MAENRPVIDDRLQHIAFIMDGNGRWAQKRGLKRQDGHREGSEAFKRVVSYCSELGLKAVTVYAFSTENWKRPKEEVDSLMKLLERYLTSSKDELMKRGVRFRVIGDKSVLSPGLIKKINNMERATAGNPLLLNFALNYGGRDELVRAFKKLSDSGKTDITEQDISLALDTFDCMDPDLVVRTGGDIRISNFLIWQAAYSELYFADVLWPDITKEHIDAAISDFYSRQRRYGGIKS
jgi:undecaprenyl diphosphate synthase